VPRSLMLTFDITAALLCSCSDSFLSKTVPTAFAPTVAYLHFCSGSLTRSYTPTATLRAAELNCRFCTVPSDACACTLPYTAARFLAQESRLHSCERQLHALDETIRRVHWAPLLACILAAAASHAPAWPLFVEWGLMGLVP